MRGFTLIETIIYIALFGIIIGGVTAAVYGIIQASGRGQTKIMAQEEAGFLLGKFNWALTGACAVSIPASGVPAPSLSVTKKYDSSGCTTLASPLIFDVSGAKLRLSGTDLNSDVVQVINLAFQDYPSANGKPQGVKVSFTLRSLTPNGVSIDQAFETTKYLR